MVSTLLYEIVPTFKTDHVLIFIVSALFLGAMHSFEADHILAMSSIVTQKPKWKHAVRAGAFWGMGHTSTIVIVGILMILLKVAIPVRYFHYFEALVGVMLILLGAYSIYRFFKNNKVVLHRHSHDHYDGAHHVHSHVHLHVNNTERHTHAHLSYGVGLVHGLAGSGELVVAAAALYINPWLGVAYLLIFGIGTIFGMALATGLLHIPFTHNAVLSPKLTVALTWLSALLCIGYGVMVIFRNLALTGVISI
jgi:ABC-type nickel/cobalt efflux system permease component RcnA